VSGPRNIFFSLFITRVDHTLSPWNPIRTSVRLNIRACINIAYEEREKERERDWSECFLRDHSAWYLCGILRNCSGINAASLCIYTIYREMRLTVRGDRCTCTLNVWRYKMFAQTRNNGSAWNLCRRDANCIAASNLLSKLWRDPFDWLKQLSLLCEITFLRGYVFPRDYANRTDKKNYAFLQYFIHMIKYLVIL